MAAWALGTGHPQAGGQACLRGEGMRLHRRERGLWVRVLLPPLTCCEVLGKVTHPYTREIAVLSHGAAVRIERVKVEKDTLDKARWAAVAVCRGPLHPTGNAPAPGGDISAGP